MGIACVFGEFPPASSAALDLSCYGAESPITQSRVCSAKSGPQRLHSGFSSRPAAVEYFNQNQSEIFKTTMLPSWHICFLFHFLRIMTHAQCFQVKAPHSLYSLSSSTQSFAPQNPLPEMEPNPPRRRLERGSPLHTLPCTPGTSFSQVGASAGQMMLGLGRQRQELLGTRIGPHAGSVAEAQQRECTAPMHLWFSGGFF